MARSVVHRTESAFDVNDEVELAVKWAGGRDPAADMANWKKNDWKMLEAYRDALSLGNVPPELFPPEKYLKEKLHLDIKELKEGYNEQQEANKATAKKSRDSGRTDATALKAKAGIAKTEKTEAHTQARKSLKEYVASQKAKLSTANSASLTPANPITPAAAITPADPVGPAAPASMFMGPQLPKRKHTKKPVDPNAAIGPAAPASMFMGPQLPKRKHTKKEASVEAINHPTPISATVESDSLGDKEKSHTVEEIKQMRKEIAQSIREFRKGITESLKGVDKKTEAAVSKAATVSPELTKAPSDKVENVQSDPLKIEPATPKLENNIKDKKDTAPTNKSSAQLELLRKIEYNTRPDSEKGDRVPDAKSGESKQTGWLKAIFNVFKKDKNSNVSAALKSDGKTKETKSEKSPTFGSIKKSFLSPFTAIVDQVKRPLLAMAKPFQTMGKKISGLFGGGTAEDKREKREVIQIRLLTSILKELSKISTFLKPKEDPGFIKSEDTSVAKKDNGISGMLKDAGKMIEGLFGKVFDGLKGIVPMILKAFSGLGGAVLGVLGAAFVGYEIGKQIVNPLINDLVQWITGDATATLGTAFYDMIGAIKDKIGSILPDFMRPNWLKSDKTKQSESDTKMNDTLKKARITNYDNLTKKMSAKLEKVSTEVEKVAIKQDIAKVEAYKDKKEDVPLAMMGEMNKKYSSDAKVEVKDKPKAGEEKSNGSISKIDTPASLEPQSTPSSIADKSSEVIVAQSKAQATDIGKATSTPPAAPVANINTTNSTSFISMRSLVRNNEESMSAWKMRAA